MVGNSYRGALLFIVSPVLVSCGQSAGALSAQDLANWLEAYGSAWETKNTESVTAIFTADALYQETPYAEPFAGSEAIGEYWSSVTADQADIDFSFDVVGVSGNTGTATWSARFRSVSGDVPVELNGVFILEFADPGRVSSLREWWHVR